MRKAQTAFSRLQPESPDNGCRELPRGFPIQQPAVNSQPKTNQKALGKRLPFLTFAGVK